MECKMKEYILSVICVSIIGSVVSMLTPEGEGGGLGRHTKLIFGLCLIIVSLYPIKNVILYLDELDIKTQVGESSPDNEELESIFDSSYNASEAENLKSGIINILCRRFEMDMSECRVDLTFRDVPASGTEIGTKRELERIFITLYGSAIWKDTGEIEDYFTSIFKCEVVTAIG